MKSLNQSVVPMRFWRAGSERAAVLVSVLPVASSTLRAFGSHTHIVSKAGLGATRVNASVLPGEESEDAYGYEQSTAGRGTWGRHPRA